MRRLIPILSFFIFAAFIPRGVPASAPVLSSAAAQSDGIDHALLSVSTNSASGTLYYIVDANCSTPTAAQIQAGHNAAGSAATIAGNQVVSSSGAQTANPTGLSAVTTYCAFYNQHTTVDSNVAVLNNFATPGTITWTNTFTSNWTGGANAAALTSIVQNVQQALTDCIVPGTGNVVVKSTYDLQALGGGTLATTSGQLGNTASYSTQVQPGLLALPNQNSMQKTAFGNMPGSEPTGSGDTMNIVCFQYSAIILASACSALPVHFTLVMTSAITMDLTVNGQTNPSGFNSAWAVVLHEITEGMGRTWSVNDQAHNVSVIDEFSYSATNTRNITQVGTRYLSANLGATNLMSTNVYNQTNGGLDAADWSTGSNISAFTANAVPGQVLAPMSSTDIKVLSLSLGTGLSHNCRLTAGL